MDKKLTYDDYKSKISIIQVAMDLGYKYDSSKGRMKPTFNLFDTDGKQIDSIVIVNPNDSRNQGYFRHDGSRGDLISFIKENINSFPQTGLARNEIDAINRILGGMIGNMPYDYLNTFTKSNNIGGEKKEFDRERYVIGDYDQSKMINLIHNMRGIDKDIINKFSPFISMIKDLNSSHNYQNIAFPFVKPGSNEVVNYEIRGFGSFKSNTEGGDRSNAVWLADFAGNSLNVKQVYIGESPYDLMAFYQLNKNKFPMNDAVFASTGGAFSKNQIINLKDEYPNAKFNLCFDGDYAGKMYDIRVLCLLNDIPFKSLLKDDNVHIRLNSEKEIIIPLSKLSLKEFVKQSGVDSRNVQVHKSPDNFKDWNDVIKNKSESQNKTEQIEERKNAGIKR